MIKFILKWLLNKFFNLKCAAQLPCNLSLNTFFALSLNYDISISQGSVVTCLRCGGIFKYDYVASLLPSLTAKEFFLIGEQLAKLHAEVYSIVAPIFPDTM